MPELRSLHLAGEPLGQQVAEDDIDPQELPGRRAARLLAQDAAGLGRPVPLQALFAERVSARQGNGLEEEALAFAAPEDVPLAGCRGLPGGGQSLFDPDALRQALHQLLQLLGAQLLVAGRQLVQRQRLVQPPAEGQRVRPPEQHLPLGPQAAAGRLQVLRLQSAGRQLQHQLGLGARRQVRAHGGGSSSAAGGAGRREARARRGPAGPWCCCCRPAPGAPRAAAAAYINPGT